VLNTSQALSTSVKLTLPYRSTNAAAGDAAQFDHDIAAVQAKDIEGLARRS
jgi:hypothetical protein